METQKIEISQKTIIFTIGFLLSLWFLYQVRGIVVLLFIAFILMTAVNPLVKVASKFKIPTIVVMLIVYFGLITLISTVIASLVPAVVQQTKDISLALPTYMHNLEDIFNTQLDPNVAGSYLSSIPSNLLKIAAGAFSNIMNILALFFMSYYLVLERPRLHQYLLRFFPNHNAEEKAEALVLAVEKQVGGWVRGELILMLIIGIMTYIGLMLLGIPYALPLAVLAGLLEALPNLGPTIAAIPVILMGLTISPIIGLGGLLLSIVIQQVENNLIVPKVMQSATGTQPLVTILVLLVGFTLGGVAGAILAMPIFLTVQTVIKAFSPDVRRERS
jgi:predicted PurR-regulated permease PerM